MMNIMRGTRIGVAGIATVLLLSACTETTTEPLQSAAGGSTSVAAENPDAVLQTANKLARDTQEAATHDRSQSKLPYIGAWAASAQGCAQIDQTVYDSFAVITPTSIRQFEESCTYSPPPTTSNVHRLDVTCTAEGETSRRVITIEIVTGQTIRFQNSTPSGRTWEMYRCHLPYN